MRFINNGIAFLFNENWNELGECVIDRNLNPSITMKTYIFYSFHEINRWKYSSWDIEVTPLILDDNGNFNICVPLRLLLGFCEDFQKVIINARQELVITTIASEKPKVLHNIIWKVPHVALSDVQKLKFLQYIKRSQDSPRAFRTWKLHEYPLLQQTMKHT